MKRFYHTNDLSQGFTLQPNQGHRAQHVPGHEEPKHAVSFLIYISEKEEKKQT